MRTKKATRGAGRTRNWTAVVYPESAPDDWIDLIQREHIEWILSPLHDKDISGDGQPKKPHYHIAILFASVKTYEQAKAFTDMLNCPRPERVHSIKSLVRYMAHLDDPDKAQYDPGEIKGYGGVDISDMLRPNGSERYQLISDMLEYICDENIVEFKDLMNYARQEHFSDWFPLLCDNSAYIVNQYIKSQRHAGTIRVDKRTGEVMR